MERDSASSEGKGGEDAFLTAEEFPADTMLQGALPLQ
jgi:hypothetical protein